MAWEPRYYNGTQRVFVQTDEDGQLILEQGLVPARFGRQEDTRLYHISPTKLSAERGVMVTAHSPTSPKPPALPKPPDDDLERCWREPAGPKLVSVQIPSVLADYPHAWPEDFIEVYTDGACSGNPGPCAYGVLIRYRGHYKEISQYLGHGTNNIAELMAIGVALEQLKRPELPVRLHTDSTYAIGVLSQGWKAKANQALIAQIKARLQVFSQLSLIKVKGHSGHPLNDRVDELATGAIAQRDLLAE